MKTHRAFWGSFFAAIAVATVACVGDDDQTSPVPSTPEIDPAQKGPPVPATRDTKELFDNGDDPNTAGCVRLYPSTNTTCAGDGEDWGDYCNYPLGQSDGYPFPEKIMERLDSTTCGNLPDGAKSFTRDCRTSIGVRGRCRTIPEKCERANTITGKSSARCEHMKDCDCYCVRHGGAQAGAAHINSDSFPYCLAPQEFCATKETTEVAPGCSGYTQADYDACAAQFGVNQPGFLNCIVGKKADGRIKCDYVELPTCLPPDAGP